MKKDMCLSLSKRYSLFMSSFDSERKERLEDRERQRRQRKTKQEVTEASEEGLIFCLRKKAGTRKVGKVTTTPMSRAGLDSNSNVSSRVE